VYVRPRQQKKEESYDNHNHSIQHTN
jgi:hypothetical protein